MATACFSRELPSTRQQTSFPADFYSPTLALATAHTSLLALRSGCSSSASLLTIQEASAHTNHPPNQGIDAAFCKSPLGTSLEATGNCVTHWVTLQE